MIGPQHARRLTTTVFVVLALLFSQFALANYACPSAPVTASAAGAMQMAPGEPCEGTGVQMDQGQPVLCHQYCVNAPQSFEALQLPVLSLPAIVQVLVVPQLLDHEADELSVHADAGQARPPPDPVFLSTLRLRV